MPRADPNPDRDRDRAVAAPHAPPTANPPRAPTTGSAVRVEIDDHLLWACADLPPGSAAERRCRYVHAVDIDAKRVPPPAPQAPPAAAGPTWHYGIAAPRTAAGPAGWLTAPIHAAGNALRALFGVAQKAEEVIESGAVRGAEKVKDVGVAMADGAAETAERVARVAGRAVHGVHDAADRAKHGVQDAVHGAQESAARAAHHVQDAAGRAAHGVQDAVHGAQDTANRVVQRAKTKAGQVAHGARDAAAHAAHQFRDSAAHAVHGVADSASAVTHGAHDAMIRAEAGVEQLGHAAAGTVKHAAHQVEDAASTVAQTARHAAQSAAHELASTVHRLRDLVAALPNPVASRSGYDYGEYEIVYKRKPRDRDHRRAAAKELKDSETRQQAGARDAPLADKFRSQQSAVDRDLHHASHEFHAIADSVDEIEHLLARAAHGVAALGDMALGPDGIGHRRVAESTDHHRVPVPAVPMVPPAPPAAAVAPQQQPHVVHPRPEVMSAVAPFATAPWTVPFVPFPITAACAVLLALGYAAASRALARNRERLRVWHGDGLHELDKYILTSAVAMERDRAMGQAGIVNGEGSPGRAERARYTVVPANLKALLGSALAVKSMNASAPVPLVLLALVEISGLTQWTILLAIALTMAQYLQYAGIDDDVHRLCEDRIIMHGRPPVLAKPPVLGMEDGEAVPVEHHPPPPEELAEPYVPGEPRPIGAQLFGQIKDGVVHEVEEIVHGVERALPANVRSWHPTTSGVGRAINWGVQAVELGLLGLRVSGMAQ
ncbi:hypothetical protein GGF32_002872 [Allomyces javanicus]|nr:hypothetical protein GGF32_002872 [Allomyces javanicus]